MTEDISKNIAIMGFLQAILQAIVLTLLACHIYDALSRIARALETLASCVTPKEGPKP